VGIDVRTPTSDLLDAHPELTCVHLQFRSLGGLSSFDGPIRTLKCVDDTLLLAELVAKPGDGAVLVVDGEASPRCALIGDRHASTAAANGWAGVVVYGMARDVAGLRDVRLGVRALGAVPRRSGKTGRGEIDVPVTFGGVVFEPGGWVWADLDGIVAASADWVAQRRSR
jgi:regulator of ribonuclease activity A